ncbi:MAG: type II toxin-antitoxin system RelE/ParE family toxin [Methanolobus sp.]|uniref:type II toxin-antitoxin system RelE family toxin n=1 Tax=Methanolobus sp. TaxID=1874737 RepID=UPI00272F47BA|nr:type II toxin-antitoxin system RelE/ParE family toxin [Methanolobus sp.]MDP2217575.1 type II toxin-antitoxin system RelE/ParE family toxin [Methanolobus sp.]
MTYTVIFSENAKKQFQKLEQNVQKRIIAALERIRIRPESYISKLVGDPGYKYRVGDYRIILDLDNENLYILVIMIGHRKSIYTR